MKAARFALILLLAGCGRDRSSCPTCDTAVIAAIGEPASILPPLVEESVGRDIGDQVFERLALLEPGGAPIDTSAYRPALAERWEELLVVRETAQKALEAKRANREIGSSLEAAVTLHIPEKQFEQIAADRALLEDLLIVSGVEVVRAEGDEIGVDVRRADGSKCERCWHYRTSVGEDAALPTVCDRCVEHLKEGWPEMETA